MDSEKLLSLNEHHQFITRVQYAVNELEQLKQYLVNKNDRGKFETKEYVTLEADTEEAITLPVYGNVALALADFLLSRYSADLERAKAEFEKL